MTDIPFKLLEISERKGKEEIQLKYIKYLYENREKVDKEPDFKDYISISISNLHIIDIEVVLNSLVGKLIYDNKIGIKMVEIYHSKSETTQFILEVK